MAPEVHTKCYGMKCDVWSLGIMLFFLLTGKFPFKGETQEEIENNVKVGEINFAQKEWRLLQCLRKDLVENLIKRMLEKKEKKRVTAKQALQLVDEWLQEIKNEVSI